MGRQGRSDASSTKVKKEKKVVNKTKGKAPCDLLQAERTAHNKGRKHKADILSKETPKVLKVPRGTARRKRRQYLQVHYTNTLTGVLREGV